MKDLCTVLLCMNSRLFIGANEVSQVTFYVVLELARELGRGDVCD